MSISNGEHTFAQDVLEAGDAIRSFTADGSISLRKAVDINGDNQVTQVGTAGNPVYGVALYDVEDGEEIAVAVDGCEVRVEAGGAVTAGNAVAVDTDGNFVDAGGDTSGDNVVGTALEGATDGDIFSLYIDTTVGVPQ
jgi:hypothetical protein